MPDSSQQPRPASADPGASGSPLADPKESGDALRAAAVGAMPPDPDEEGIHKEERKRRLRDMKAWKARVKHQEALAKKRGVFRWQGLAGLPLVFIIFGVLYVVFGNSLARSAMVSGLQAALGPHTRVDIEDVDFSIFGPKLSAKNVRCYHPTRELSANELESQLATLGDDEWAEVAGFSELTAKVELLPLLGGRVWIEDFVFDGLGVHPKAMKKLKEDKPEDPPAAPKTPIEQINEILQTIEDLRKNEYVQMAEKYAREMLAEDTPEEKAEKERIARAIAAQPPRSPKYIRDHIAAQPNNPLFLLRSGRISGMTMYFDDTGFDKKGVERAFHRFADTALVVTDVSSDPLSWGQVVKAEGRGLVNGKADRAVALNLAINFPAYMGKAGGASSTEPSYLEVNSKALEFARWLKKPFREVGAGFYVFPPNHPQAPNGYAVAFNGKLADSPARFAAALWLPSATERDNLGAISFAIEDVPLDELMSKLGELPFAFEPGVTGTLATCDADGTTEADRGFGRPSNPKTGFMVKGNHFEFHLKLGVRNLRIKPMPGQSVMGIPAEHFVPAFNRLAAEMEQRDGSIHFQVGFIGEPGKASFKLEKPGSRGLIDAVINAALMTGAELNAINELNLVFGKDAAVSLQSLDANGNKRNWDSPLAASNDLSGLRAGLTLRGMKVEKARGPVLGIPGDWFVRGFNGALDANGNLEWQPTFRLVDDKGSFKPSLEEDNERPLAVPMARSLALTSDDLSAWKELNLDFERGGRLRLLPIDENGIELSATQKGSKANLRVAVTGENLKLKRARGPVMGIPGDLFVEAFNTSAGQGGGLPVTLGARLFDAQGSFSPSIENASFRPLVTAIAGVLPLTYKDMTGGASVGGIVFEPTMRIALKPAPVENTGKAVPANGPGLEELAFDARLAGAQLDAKKQPAKIAGVPSQYFVFAWNKYLVNLAEGAPARVQLFNKKADFSPSLSFDPAAMLPELGKAVGVDDFAKNPEKVAQLFTKEFEGFLKDPSKALEGVAKDPGKAAKDVVDDIFGTKDPKKPDGTTTPKYNLPKPPEAPKLPIPLPGQGGDKPADKPADGKPGETPAKPAEKPKLPTPKLPGW